MIIGAGAHYKLNETSGTSIADSAGTNTGTWAGTGAQGLTSMTAKVGGGLFFDGGAAGSDVITAPADPSIDIKGKTSYSVSTWIRPASVGRTTGRIIDKANNNNATLGYNFLLRDEVAGFTKLQVIIQHAITDAQARSDAVVPNNLWSHVAFVYNEDSDGKIKLYLNALLLALDIDIAGNVIGSPSNDSALDLNIGNSAAKDRTFDGTIDNIIIYNRALGIDEIQQQYNLRRHERGRTRTRDRISRNW